MDTPSEGFEGGKEAQRQGDFMNNLKYIHLHAQHENEPTEAQIFSTWKNFHMLRSLRSNQMENPISASWLQSVPPPTKRIIVSRTGC